MESTKSLSSLISFVQVLLFPLKNTSEMTPQFTELPSSLTDKSSFNNFLVLKNGEQTSGKESGYCFS